MEGRIVHLFGVYILRDRGIANRGLLHLLTSRDESVMRNNTWLLLAW